MFSFIKKIFSEKDGFHLSNTVEFFRDAYKLTLISFEGENDYCSLGMNVNEVTRLLPQSFNDGFGHTFLFRAGNTSIFNNSLLHFSDMAHLDIGYMVRNGVREEQYLRVTFSYNTGNYFGYDRLCGGYRGDTYKYDILDPDTFCIKSYDDIRNIKAKASFKIHRRDPDSYYMYGS